MIAAGIAFCAVCSDPKDVSPPTTEGVKCTFLSAGGLDVRVLWREGDECFELPLEGGGEGDFLPMGS